VIKNMLKTALAVLVLGVLVSGCSKDKEETSSAPGMKCGAGKCGANMFDGNSALAKKKKNILSQMRKDDPRKDCVVAAKTTKAAYDCVREPDGKKLTMKCGAGKCGTKQERASEPSMKCGAGKCGASMQEKKPKKDQPAMKCGAGKCGGSM